MLHEEASRLLELKSQSTSNQLPYGKLQISLKLLNTHFLTHPIKKHHLKYAFEKLLQEPKEKNKNNGRTQTSCQLAVFTTPTSWAHWLFDTSEFNNIITQQYIFKQQELLECRLTAWVNRESAIMSKNNMDHCISTICQKDSILREDTKSSQGTRLHSSALPSWLKKKRGTSKLMQRLK